MCLVILTDMTEKEYNQMLERYKRMDQEAGLD